MPQNAQIDAIKVDRPTAIHPRIFFVFAVTVPPIDCAFKFFLPCRNKIISLTLTDYIYKFKTKINQMQQKFRRHQHNILNRG